MGARLTLLVASLSVTITGGAVALLLGGDWTVTCPETHATGWMDCGGQPDARWHSDALPGWMSPELLFGAAVAGLAGLAVAVAFELRRRRRDPFGRAATCATR
jgi:hypothetical protein